MQHRNHIVYKVIQSAVIEMYVSQHVGTIWTNVAVLCCHGESSSLIHIHVSYD